MVVTTSWISKHYDKFNDLYFGGMLPSIQFKVNRSKNSWGMASFRYDWVNGTIIPTCITISNYYDSPEDVKIQTLLHEMIHIEDYFWHPEHFIKNGRKVTGHTYDAHGYWFKEEAKRLSKESGYKITNHVTKEEMNSSKLSKTAERNIANKIDNAIIGVVYGTNGYNFYFKTDVWKVKDMKKTINSYYFHKIGSVRKVKFYTFENESLASMRSCGKRLRGWFLNNEGMLKKLEKIKATEYIF